MGKLDGKIAVITGGSSGMALASARRFVEEGAYVFITGRRQEALDEAVRLIGRNVTGVRGDAADLDDLDRLFDTVRREKGRIDVLYASAGTGEAVPLGEITEQHVLDDAIAAFDWLQAKGQPIVIWGRSLGSGPATYVASTREADALLLETPFLSAVTVAFERYPFLPVSLLMDDQYPVDTWIKTVDEPVFIAHGTADQTIDVSNGERLYKLVPHKYDLWIVDGAGHSALWDAGIWEKAKVFFEDAEIGARG